MKLQSSAILFIWFGQATLHRPGYLFTMWGRVRSIILVEGGVRVYKTHTIIMAEGGGNFDEGKKHFDLLNQMFVQDLEM